MSAKSSQSVLSENAPETRCIHCCLCTYAVVSGSFEQLLLTQPDCFINISTRSQGIEVTGRRVCVCAERLCTLRWASMTAVRQTATQRWRRAGRRARTTRSSRVLSPAKGMPLCDRAAWRKPSRSTRSPSPSTGARTHTSSGKLQECFEPHVCAGLKLTANRLGLKYLFALTAQQASTVCLCSRPSDMAFILYWRKLTGVGVPIVRIIGPIKRKVQMNLMTPAERTCACTGMLRH